MQELAEQISETQLEIQEIRWSGTGLIKKQDYSVYEGCLKSIRPLAGKNILLRRRDWNPNPLQSRLLAPPHT
jgi:hypothetical protein